MASKGVSTLKFVGTVSLGLLTVSACQLIPIPPPPPLFSPHRVGVVAPRLFE